MAETTEFLNNIILRGILIYSFTLYKSEGGPLQKIYIVSNTTSTSKYLKTAPPPICEFPIYNKFKTVLVALDSLN